ncbi:L,D-transpeptidase family protein [Gillisia limnaea]|uniref:ErfK/YbiS/YcfS/YnhG family protein n=1 Tax=Gillisia limnaea (strain DSM 15749 / LMG 21470 / R-8282) TaxID=865937 RepID=H2BX15_GILLR|nr:L,D-transpeptidase family protein [Gillisia limnaea]EHQ01967.1 ErfK/YbiS/YcfS/YnhG family protein [Gillisia limnaea DSM 15749]
MNLSFLIRRWNFITGIIFLAILVCGCRNESEQDKEFSEDLRNGIVISMGSSKELEPILYESTEAKLFQKDSVIAFYLERDFKPAWTNINFRNSLIDTLKSAHSQGLYFKDYHGEELEKQLLELSTLDKKELSELDMLLTDAFFKFMDHLYNGKVDPKSVHRIWDVSKKQHSKLKLLEKAVKENNLEIALSQLRPVHPVYKDLIAAEKEYRKLKEDAEDFKKIEKGVKIKPGNQDIRLQEIQFRLLQLGYLKSLKIGGSQYDNETVDAIKKIQEAYGLLADGIIGDKTVDLLNKGYDQRYGQILVNLERWRWFPRDLGSHYILVNIANFKLQVVREKDTISTYKTIVGRVSRKTPIFSEEIDHLIFNPSWTIPPTIKNNDVIPGVRKNLDYLSNKNIQVYNTKGEKLDPSKIDWTKSEVKSFSYRQPPGNSNPLGKVKIMYPNSYLIYLHDTPSQSIFDQNSRAQSSGCIRVENAIDLSKYLLRDQPEYTSELLDSIINRGVIKRIDMKQKVNIHHFYWTAWRENGETIFTDDIYNYDEATLQALKKAS